MSTTCILPFREWKENFVTVHFGLEERVVIIKSKLTDSVLFSSMKPSYIDAMKENQSKVLLQMYRDLFDLIQYQYNELIKNSDELDKLKNIS